MLRQASYGTIKIGTYQSLKRMFVEHPEGEQFVCGCSVSWEVSGFVNVQLNFFIFFME